MPKKKSSEKASVIYAKTPRVDSFAAVAKEVRLSESYKSLLLGIAVVLLAAVLVGGFIKNRNTQNMHIPPIKPPLSVKTKSTLPIIGTHTVQVGDDLKTISIQYYETPDLFLTIAKFNNISNPDIIDEGKQLMIPKITKNQFTPSLINATTNPIMETSYTVIDGDLLWNIAVRAYEDGYKWKDILRDNNLPAADAIFPGMILQLPR